MPDDTDALDRQVQQAFLRTNTALGENHADLVAVATTVQALVDLLVGRGVLGAADLQAALADARARLDGSPLAKRGMVRASELLRDKYQEPNADVDCEARMPVCKGACCGCRVPLAKQDVVEGALKWDLANPYYLRQTADGRCVHQSTTTGFCTVYDRRPLACRSYTCRNDPRIWKDFENRIPNEKGIETLLHGRAQRPITLHLHKTAVPDPL